MCGVDWRRTNRRGATLVSTVLVSLVVATIGMVVVRQAVLASRTSADATDAAAAVTKAHEVLIDLEQALASNPSVLFEQVLAFEQSRTCNVASASDVELVEANPDHPVYEPGDVWPAKCGTSWTYTAAGGGNDDVRVALRPPSATDPTLRAEVLGRTGRIEMGVVATYRLQGAGRFAVWSGQDLRLDEMFTSSGTGGANLSGGVYAGGSMFLPSGADVTFSDAQLMAEDGFVGAAADAATRYYQQDVDLGVSPPLRDIRDVVPDAGGLVGFRAGAATLEDVACRGAHPVLFGVADPDLEGYSSQLCLKQGSTVMAPDGSELEVPGASAWLLLPGASGPRTMDVYYSVSSHRPAGWCPAIRCDLTTLAAPEVGAAAHPGVLASWTSLGTLALPVSGVVATDSTTYLSLCGDAFLVAGSTCDSFNADGLPGVKVDDNLTVLVGVEGMQQSAFLSGPIRSGSGRLAVVASGDVFVPFWARPAQSVLELDVSVVALPPASQLRSSTPIRSLPERMPPSSGASDPNYAAMLVWTGSVAASEVRLDLAGFDEVAFNPDEATMRRPPPWLPGPTFSWERVSSRRFTAFEACGLRTCDAF